MYIKKGHLVYNSEILYLKLQSLKVLLKATPHCEKKICE